MRHKKRSIFPSAGAVIGKPLRDRIAGILRLEIKTHRLEASKIEFIAGLRDCRLLNTDDILEYDCGYWNGSHTGVLATNRKREMCGIWINELDLRASAIVCFRFKCGQCFSFKRGSAHGPAAAWNCEASQTADYLLSHVYQASGIFSCSVNLNKFPMFDRHHNCRDYSSCDAAMRCGTHFRWYP